MARAVAARRRREADLLPSFQRSHCHGREYAIARRRVQLSRVIVLFRGLFCLSCPSLSSLRVRFHIVMRTTSLRGGSTQLRATHRYAEFHIVTRRFHIVMRSSTSLRGVPHRYAEVPHSYAQHIVTRGSTSLRGGRRSAGHTVTRGSTPLRGVPHRYVGFPTVTQRSPFRGTHRYAGFHIITRRTPFRGGHRSAESIRNTEVIVTRSILEHIFTFYRRYQRRSSTSPSLH